MNSRSANRWLSLQWLLLAATWSPLVLANEPVSTAPVAERSDALPAEQEVRSKPRQEPAQDADAVPQPAEIAAWIADLDDNRYLVREAATRRLMESGTVSFDGLLAAANGDRPEPADRAVWILRRLSNGKDQALRRPALERLVLLQNRPQVASAAREALAQLRHTEAVEAIQRLGGRYVASEYLVEVSLYRTPRVVIDQQWRGGDAGFEHIPHLLAVRQVIVIGADITADALNHLQQANTLESVLLYGTKLEPEDVPKVQKVLPQVEIDYRRGGLLGVGSNAPDGMGPAVVAILSRGSVAEAAGIQVGDIIQKFENQPVQNFKALTLMIGKHRAGEEVTLEVLRNGKPLKFTLKLGAWQTVN